MNAPQTPAILPDDDQLFRLLRQLDRMPEAPQRATAEALGLSLGKLNALLHSAQAAGFIRITGRDSTDRRQRFAYALTAKGAAEKAAKQAELEQTPEYKLQQQLKFKKENKPPQFIKMDEFTVNLPGRGGEHYLQASLVLRTADGSTEGRIKDFLPIVRDRVILVLSSRTMQELSTVEGKNAMAREIALVINSIIEPQLTAIFILQQQPGTADLQNLERIGAMPQSTTAGEKLSQTAVQAAAQFWKVSEMDLPVQQVLFDKFVMQ